MKKIKFIKSGFIAMFIMAVISVSLSSCVAFFYPKNQSVTFNTGNKEAKVYIDNTEAGKGMLVTEKVKKWGAHQVVVKTPGYKDTYAAMVQTHRAPGFWVCLFFDLPGSLFFGYPILIDIAVPKGLSYDPQISLKSIDKLVNRDPTDKYIDISNISLDIKNKEKDVNFFISGILKVL